MMAGKKSSNENGKKASGNAKKAEAAALKAAKENLKKTVVEDEEWSKGAKSNAKKEAADAKRDEILRKKAEKDALLAAEENEARATPKNAKSAPKKSSRGLDLSQVDETPSSLNASNISDALDLLDLAASNTVEPDRHPERRFKPAFAAYLARRMPEVEEESPGLRKQQRVDLIRKEFEKSDENPFNRVTAKFDDSKDDITEIRAKERAKLESRLGG
ncbi:MAG: hypothetical protein M1829_002142 [Trizodia sp. TS-e1964]|nr:MAG: hypothetical protein M1829_002142 [Trizodia sp. TS-e1964]